MLQNYMLLPFYEQKEQQFRFRNNCQNGEEFHSFRVPNYTLPSFFFKRNKRAEVIQDFRVYDLDDNLIATLNDLRHLHVVSSPNFDGYGYVPNRIENGLSTFSDPSAGGDQNYDNYLLPCGKYYILISEQSNTGKSYYSEIFEVVDSTPITDANELVLNGGFATDFSGWLTSGTWSIAASKAVYAGGGGGFILDQIINNPDDDGIHFYRFSVTITNYNDSGDATRYLRIYCNGLDAMNSIFIRANGTYTFYFKKASRVIIQSFNGTVTFNVDDISIQRVVGAEEHVMLTLSKSCKFPNSIDKANHNYFNNYLLDAVILEPEYGEERVENENGDIEKVLSFVRPFKRHKIEPMLQPEPVADALAQLNTFDIAEVYDGWKDNIFLLNSLLSELIIRSIQAFESKFEWQQGECYMLANIAFEENLALFDKCCDDTQEIAACLDPTEEIIIAQEGVVDHPHYHISLVNTPTGLSGAMISLYYDKQLRSAFTDCASVPGGMTYTGISIPYDDFAADGIDFFVNDYTLYTYKFYVVATQIGCEDSITSAGVCE